MATTFTDNSWLCGRCLWNDDVVLASLEERIHSGSPLKQRAVLLHGENRPEQLFPTMTSTCSSTPTLDALLGGEAHQLDAHVEIAGVQAMMEELTRDEMTALADPSMPVRHFRAEKVSPWQ